ncbi:isocitrate lyase/phosphoenolpyruvate mutase family protein [Umezawaea endophytica]|uniref:Isocitrate lyase/phosphoenolpyruvate mutase family protein n=1 Tax=Umezawaea endophytica TaxID=1654476 RepID=A0A9X3AJ32_9PSEU|nr:isocitrate lyase/phosphoenolpyruvate mutase family protein [Umezawaea endophytica]MCS7483947.1 isocitrate lyase/phosphoenolpyruvate mutase family protein [Umezawaea endophytica]
MTFHDLHHADRPLVLPNAWDFASAAALCAAGFAAIGTTSLGVAAAAGLPDGEGVTRDETVALARRIVGLPVPVTVDIESGFSVDVRELAAELTSLGVAGVNIEDGRPGGVLADPVEQARLVRAVKDGGPGLFVNARVDTYWVGADQGSTVDRALRYRDAGADGVFVPGLARELEIAAVVEAVDLPLNVLHVPALGVERLAGLGVRRISTGSLLFRAALHAAVETAKAVRDGGPVADGVPTYADVLALTTPGSGRGSGFPRR